jgi:hypothetical protein
VDKVDLVERIYAYFGITSRPISSSEFGQPDDTDYASRPQGSGAASTKFDIKLPSIFHRKRGVVDGSHESGAKEGDGYNDGVKTSHASRLGNHITSEKLRDLEERVRNRSVNARGGRHTSAENTHSSSHAHYTDTGTANAEPVSSSKVLPEKQYPKTPQKQENHKPFRRNMSQESIYQPPVGAKIPGARYSSDASDAFNGNGRSVHEASVPEWMKEMQEQQSRLREKLESDDFNPDYFADLLHQAALFDLQDNKIEHGKVSSAGVDRNEAEKVSIFHSGYYFGSDSDEPSDDESAIKGAIPSSVKYASGPNDENAYLDSRKTKDGDTNSKNTSIQRSPIHDSPKQTQKNTTGTKKSEKETVNNHSNDICEDNDDFIELQWDHFLPPVKCVPATDVRQNETNVPTTRTQANSDTFDVKSPLNKVSSRPISPIKTDFEPMYKNEPTPSRMLKKFLQEDKLSKSFLFDGNQFDHGNIINISLPKRGLGDSMEMLRNDESFVDQDGSDVFHSVLNKQNAENPHINNDGLHLPESVHFSTAFPEASRGNILETRNSSLGSVILDNDESDDDAIDFNTAHAPFEIAGLVSKGISPHKAGNGSTDSGLRVSADSGVLYSSMGSGQMFLRTVQLSPSIPTTQRFKREALDTVTVQDV